ncbi:MAG: substrate-binding domain-containing protein [Planctomycetota bacterium]|nr:substrate-binding domain-containing protein [Planctomycetota bacterium]
MSNCSCRFCFSVAAFALLTMVLASVGQSQTTATPTSNSKPLPKGTEAPATQPIQGSMTQHDIEHAALMRLIDSIEPYHKQKELKGAATLSGSTTMLALGSKWSERFKKFHQEVVFSRGTDGTEAGIKALAEDPTVIAGASRPLTEKDLADLKKGKCKDPLSVIVALDPLALYVHKSNPIAGVTPEQLESIFRAPGGKGKHFSTWGDLGVTGELASKPIRIHSRSEVSGTTTFIKQMVLRGEEMAKEVQLHKSNQEICTAIGTDLGGVGICGFGEATDQVRPVSLIMNGVRVPATEQSFLSGQYPFVRPLLLIIDKAQMGSDGGLREAVLRYVLSRDGQLEAVREGFFPLDPAFIRKQLDQISGPQMR